MSTDYMKFSKNRVVAIPVIQRDYVQGADRNRSKRDEFLTNLMGSLQSEDAFVNLDFIYGTKRVKEGGVAGTDMESLPVDGQQRLTTLYLLAWLLAQRGLNQAQRPELPRLEYRTRPATQQFVDKLRAHALPEDLDLSAARAVSLHLTTEPDWFAEDWKDDPSVTAMLQMLDAMNSMLNQVPAALPDMARRFFHANPVRFEFLDMEEYKLDEDLYLKMNARGKPLTNFENWKAEFGKFLKYTYPDDKYNSQYAIPEYFDYAIEQPWCDLFWDWAIKKWQALAREDGSPFPRIDEFFMKFFDHVTELLFYAQRDVEKEVKKFNEGRGTVSGLKIGNALLFAGPGGAWQHENTLEVYAKKENVLFLFHLLDLFSSLEKQPGGIEAFFKGLLTAKRALKTPDKVSIFSDSKAALNLFGEIIAPEKTAALYYRVLFYGICKRLLKYGTNNQHHELSDFIRVFWGWILGVRQLVSENLAVESDLRVESVRQADQTLEVLLGDCDVFTVLDTVAKRSDIPKPVRDSLKGEVEKASWRHKGKYDAIKLLSQFRALRGDLHHLYPALEQLSAQECVSRFEDFCHKNSAERVRLLCTHGFNGIATWGDSYRYYGYKNHWPLVFAREDPALTNAVTDMLLQKPAAPVTKDEMRWYMIQYEAFRTSSPVNFFYVEAPFIIWTRLNGKVRRMGYAHCPYAYTVAQLLDDEDRKLLEATDWSYYSEHGRLWLNAVGLSLECVEDGWNIEWDDKKKMKKFPALRRFAITEAGVEDAGGIYTFDGTVLQDLPKTDRVQTAVAFVKELAKLMRK